MKIWNFAQGVIIMSRAKYQVLVLPYSIQDKTIEYCIFKRRDLNIWQFIAGGGEIDDKSILETAKREAFEETGINKENKFVALETQCSISTECFPKARLKWGEECLVIPEYSFAVEVTNNDLKISNEHTEYKWVDYQSALMMLKYDSNKVALWELDNKIKMGKI